MRSTWLLVPSIDWKNGARKTIIFVKKSLFNVSNSNLNQSTKTDQFFLNI